MNIPRMRRQFAYHLAKYQENQAVVSDLEAQAEEIARRPQRLVGGRELPQVYIAKRILEDSLYYRKYTGARDAHLRAAQMLAASLLLLGQEMPAGFPKPRGAPDPADTRARRS